MNYLDSHCHINDESYLEDLDEVLDRMVTNKVTKAMLVCVSLDDYKRSLDIKKRVLPLRRLLVFILNTLICQMLSLKSMLSL